MVFPEPVGYSISVKDGVYQLSFPKKGLSTAKFPSWNDFVKDFGTMIGMITDGPLKTYCFRRLQYLGLLFKLHKLMNEMQESSQQKSVPHRDFYNVRKVSTRLG